MYVFQLNNVMRLGKRGATLLRYLEDLDEEDFENLLEELEAEEEEREEEENEEESPVGHLNQLLYTEPEGESEF